MAHAFYREEHPLPTVITHWVNLLCMVGLGISGLYIHQPFFSWSMGAARGLHFALMYVLAINLIARLIMLFTVKSAPLMGSREKKLDIFTWLPQEENKHQLWQTLKYYLFLRKEKVISGKLGVMQKIAYVAVVLIIFMQGYTGFALYTPAVQWGIWPFFKAGIDLVGGLMTMRMIHYTLMWAIIIFTAIHVYLANVHGFAPTKLMFAWVETEPKESH
jgi:Ni/Fe-hydrogenase 1 B-type cytochrome subunit